MIAMLSPRIEVLKEHRTVSAKQIRYVVSNLLVLVRRSLAAPPLVNPGRQSHRHSMLIQHGLSRAIAISSQVSRIKAERERGEGAYIST